VQTTLKASYSNHYRRGLIELLEVLEFRSNNATHRPVLDALDLIRRHADARLTYYPAGQSVPSHKGVLGDWTTLVFKDAGKAGRRVVRSVYEICTFQALREQLRCKEIWVIGADKWRNPDQGLPHDFETHRDAHYAALRKPLDPTAFIDQLRGEMRDELAALDTGLPKLAWLEIADRGKNGAIKLTDLDAAPEPRNLRRLKNEVRTRWGTVPLIDMLKEAVLRTRLSLRRDRHRRAWRSRVRDPGRAAAAGDLRVRHEHRDPGDRRQRPARARRGRHPLRAPPVPDRRSRPDDRDRDRQRHVRGPGADRLGRRLHRGRLRLDALRRVRPEHLHRVAFPLRRRGVLIYWHVERKSMAIHSQLISCTASEVAAMVEGAMRHGTTMEVEGNYVDSHGQSEIGFGITPAARLRPAAADQANQ
jgi:hypothetical protein